MCGIVGVIDYSKERDVAPDIYLGLYSLQHRGQESAGITVSDNKKLRDMRGIGTIDKVFYDKDISFLKGCLGIGQNRYSTSGSKEDKIKNIQPIIRKFNGIDFAVAHNGNLINIDLLKKECQMKGYDQWRTSSDTEVIAALITCSDRDNFLLSLLKTINRLQGAFSLLILFKDKIYAIKDRHGIRPLCFGKKGNSFMIASESCAIDVWQGEFIRELYPGEMLIFDLNNKQGINFSSLWAENPSSKMCIFECIYFARPDSVLYGRNVHLIRKNMGRLLAQEHPVKADLVISVPDSGNSAAAGYSEESGIPLDTNALFRSHYVGRTFIEPIRELRKSLQRIKLNPIKEVLKGKRIVVVDDSIVRANTSKKLTKMLWEAGVKEVHWRVASPPNRFPCFLGIDTATFEELIAARLSEEEIRQTIKASSLGYLSLESTIKSVGLLKEELCCACFDGEYPL